jgi:N-acetylmuramoyl-L-alanine amidase
MSGLAALLAAIAIAIALAGEPGGASARDPAAAATGTGSGTSAPGAASAPRPRIVKRLIPYGAKRKRDMAGYSKRHYGRFNWRLSAPKLIVEHYAVAASIGAIYSTFAPNRPDVEYGELPGVCSHFAVGADGTIVKFVRTDVRCRHVVGLNHVAIGIEHVGFSDGDVLNRPAQLEASLALTDWLRCRFGIPVKGVIGHNESLASPFYRELDPRFRGRTHGDFKRASMRAYRGKLLSRAAC